MKYCQDCSTENDNFKEYCVKCGAKLSNQAKYEYRKNSYNNSVCNSNGAGLAMVLYVLGVLSVIGGLIIGIAVWPKGYSYSYTWFSYFISFAYFLSGVISCFVFFAIGRIIDAVTDIQDKLAIVQNDLKKVKSISEAAATKD